MILLSLVMLVDICGIGATLLGGWEAEKEEMSSSIIFDFKQ